MAEEEADTVPASLADTVNLNTQIEKSLMGLRMAVEGLTELSLSPVYVGEQRKMIEAILAPLASFERTMAKVKHLNTEAIQLYDKMMATLTSRNILPQGDIDGSPQDTSH